jgi:L-threonylcarbamoyladenylate synthase
VELEIVPARDDSEREEAAARAAEVLSAGGLVVHPTETVYGVGGDGSAESNRLIARVKRRQRLQPLILLATDVGALRTLLPGLLWPAESEPLAERFWPGPLTIIVPCADAPEGLQGPDGGVAVRITPDPTLVAILGSWGRPMTSTSANLTGAAPALDAREAVEVFAGRDDLEGVGTSVIAIDAGRSAGDEPSTIVSLVESPPRLVREGPVRRAELERWMEDLR